MTTTYKYKKNNPDLHLTNLSTGKNYEENRNIYIKKRE